MRNGNAFSPHRAIPLYWTKSMPGLWAHNGTCSVIRTNIFFSSVTVVYFYSRTSMFIIDFHARRERERLNHNNIIQRLPRNKLKTGGGRVSDPKVIRVSVEFGQHRWNNWWPQKNGTNREVSLTSCFHHWGGWGGGEGFINCKGL